MEYRKLGSSDLKISVIGLGCRLIGSKNLTDKESVAIIKQSIDFGINFFDTADIYANGNSEKVLGKTIKNQRDKVILATKVGMARDKKGRPIQNSSSQYILKAIDSSLNRLNTDYIDLYQIHNPDPTIRFEETVKALKKLIKTGKIRYVGLSNFTLKEIKEWIKIMDIASVQLPYNFFQREIEKHILPFCRHKNIGVLTYTPLLAGFLTGKFNRTTTFSPSDHRSQIPAEIFQSTLRICEKLKPIAKFYEKTAAQLAINWIVSQNGVTGTLVGATKLSQLKENINSIGWRLTKRDLKRIDKILKEEIKKVSPKTLIKSKVEKIGTGARRKAVALSDMGFKFEVPEFIQKGDIIKIDVQTGRFAGKVY